MTLSWASADEACTAMLEGGAVALAWNRFSPETRAVVRAEYLASLEPFRHGDRYEVRRRGTRSRPPASRGVKSKKATERFVPSLFTPLG